MNTIQPTNPETQPAVVSKSSGTGLKIGLALVAVMAIAFNLALISKVNYAESKAEEQRVSLQSEIQTLNERLATQAGKHERSLAELRESVDKNSRSAYSQARNEAQKRAAHVAKEVAVKQREQQDMFLNEIGGVKHATSTNAKDLDTVKNHVAGVSSDIAAARRDLAETEDVLLSTQDELTGVTRKVETHASDIQRLRDRTERTLTPFDLAQSKDRTKVDDIQIRLKDADVRKNRYTVEILADDQVIVQKDRYLNEPVEFYVTGADRPYEIVVTSIEKGQVSGYLSKPKFAALARR